VLPSATAANLHCKNSSAGSFTTPVSNHLGFLTGQSLPPRDRDIDEAGFELDRVAATPELLGSDQLRSAAFPGGVD